MIRVTIYQNEKKECAGFLAKGHAGFRLTDRPGKEAALLLKAMILGLEEMANDSNYSEYIQVRFEEV